MPKIKYKEFNFRDSTLRLIDQANQMPIIFHFGDHDPSGKDMSRDIQDRLELFTGRMIRFERLALNMDQVKEYDPPPNPAKITDSRAEGYIAEFGDESWELDALEPRLLDLFCCAGGAGLGYRRAGFEVVGVDIQPQPKYPFEFVQSDAIEFLLRHGREFDAIHASPPCQAYSMSSKQFRLQGKKYVDLVSPTRNALKRVGKPWIIENVPGSPLINPIMLCGAMFGLQTYRHRLFEASFLLKVPNHPEHKARNAKMGRPVEDGEFIQIAGHFSDVPFARKAMGIDWMGQKELAQAIPPAYTEYLGKQLYERIKR